MSYQKIVQIGAGGNLGKPVLDALVASGKFEITVLARPSSTFTAPNASVKVVKVDFSDHQALVNALKGNNAVALTLGDLPNLEQNSKAVVDAAIEAGVKRVLPSEYGVDTVNPPGRQEPVFGVKHKVDDYIVEKASEGVIEYTSITTGAFFDWGLTNYQFLGFDIPSKKVNIYNGGNEPFNATTLGSIGDAVVSVFSNPEKFKNKHIRISDFYVSQNEILAILEAETGSKFTVQTIDAEKLKEDTNAGLGRGEFTLVNIFGAIQASVFGQKSSARWGRGDDTESVGIPKKDLTEEIRKVL